MTIELTEDEKFLLYPNPYKRCLAGDQCVSPYGPDLPATHSYFATSKSSPDGLAPRCKYCKRAYNKQYYHKHAKEECQKARQYRAQHLQEGRFRARQYYDLHRKQKAEYDKKYRAKNRAKKRDYNRLYNQTHSEQIKLQKQKYKMSHPDRERVQSNVKRARKRALVHDFSNDDWKFTLEWWDGKCAFCGKGPSLFDRHWKLHQEHFIPTSKGGNYSADNILPACQSCNLSKHHNNAHEWVVYKFGKTKGAKILARIVAYFNEVKSRRIHSGS